MKSGHVLVAVVLALAAVVMASGRDGWGWLLVAAWLIWLNLDD